MPDSLRSRAQPTPNPAAAAPDAGEAVRAGDLAERLEALVLAYERLEPSQQARREALVKTPFDHKAWLSIHRPG